MLSEHYKYYGKLERSGVMVEIKVVFRDGEILIVSGVTNYIAQEKFYEIHKNGYRIFLNVDEVKYLGRTFDLNNKEVK